MAKQRRVKITDGPAPSTGQHNFGPKVLHDPNERTRKLLGAMESDGLDRSLVRTGFVPKPLKRIPPPECKRPALTYVEARDLVHEHDGRIVEQISVKGKVVLNCVGPIDSPATEQRPYSVVVTEEMS